MKRHRPLLLAAFATLLLFSCKRGNELRVVDQNFTDEVAGQQNLQFSFNKDVYPDSLLRSWDSTRYISFTPNVPGSFQWNSSSELTFSPAEGFKPGTTYKASLNPALLRYAKNKELKVSGQDISFHTAPLRIENYSLGYARGAGGNTTTTRLDLSFNYAVTLAQAASKIRLSSKGQHVGFSVAANGEGKVVSLLFPPLAATDAEAPLKIEIAKGIVLAGSDYKTSQDTIIKTTVPSRYSLRVNNISSSHDGATATINIATSQPLPQDGLQQLVSIEPSVAFSATADASGITITSADMKPDQTYQLTLSDRLEGTLGGRFKEAYSEQITFGKLQPAVEFINNKGMYLSTRGYRNLALRIVNEPEVTVTIVKVYENNLDHFFRQGQSGGYDYDEETDEYGSYEYYDTENLGDTIDHRTLKTDKLPAINATRILHLDLQDKLRSYDGTYVITVASTTHRWVQSSKILCLSDIGLIVKSDGNNVHAFANSIRDARPMSGVEVSFISTNNQRLYRATTNGDGECVFSDMKTAAPGFRLGMVTAKKNGEFSFIHLQNTAVEVSRFDVGGRMPNGTGLNAMVYAERNIYRPGEVAHVSVIVRDERWQKPGELPIKLRLTMPNGKEFATMRKILNEQGSTETIFPIPHTAMTGTYVLDVLSGNDVLLNTYNIAVEDFMPDRIRNTLTLNQSSAKPGDSIVAHIQADNLFGTPAMNRNYEVELNINKKEFTSKAFPDYRFGLQRDFYFDPILRTGSTSETGSADAGFALPQDLADNGLLQGSVSATVFDETGRPVHRYEKFEIFTQPYFIGIEDKTDYVGVGQTVRIPIVAVDKDDKPRSATARVVIVKKEWHTAIEQSGDHYRYVSREEEKVLREFEQQIGSGTAIAFAPALSGQYEFRIYLPGSTAYISKSLYAWGSGSSDYTSFEVNNEGNVDIRPDKEKYNRGDKVKLLFTAPFEGRMLVTLERDRMLSHHWLNTENKSASLTLDAGQDLVPNAYVTATLFRPMDGSDNPLTVAHGFRNISVEDPKTRLPLEVTVADKSRSKKKQVVTVKTAPHAFVTIAAVDEGILQIRNYETPDPYKYFYQKVALATNSYDIYPFLLPEIKYTRSSTGGDGGPEGMDGRVNPLFVNRVKNVSFWSGIVEADGSGVVRYEIDVPQFSGDIRVMAVAYKDGAFAGADQHMKVADPIVISTALPRVLSPKDQMSMGVTVTNTTPNAASAVVRVATTGPLGVAGAQEQRVSIPANREAHVVFAVNAQNSIGAANVKVSVTALNETFTNETDIAVRPPASLQRRSGSGVVQAGQTVALAVSAPYMSGSGKGKLIVGKSPLVEFSKNMDFLVHYPYGCIEQITSAAFPQLYYTDLAQALTGTTSTDPNPSYNVQQAIRRIQSQQLSNGGLSYWPGVGAGQETWWGSVYAAHFLLEARKAGYEVNEPTLDRLLQYLRYKLQSRPTEILYYNQSLSREIAAKETAYSLYVLALAGQPQVATMNYYKGNPRMLAIDSRYLLAAAYSLSGNPQAARQVLPQAFGNEQANQAYGGSFYSYIRDLGISLNALIDINPQDPQVGILARQMAGALKGNSYLNTQENVWGILALGKLSRITNQTVGSATVAAGGKNIGTTNGPAVSIDLKPYLGSGIKVSATGKGGFYYFWETSGITADGSVIEEDRFLKVRRQYYTRDGQPITGGVFRQNQLIVVKLTLESSMGRPVENVVVTDMLPAGFEIENTRLYDLPELQWITSQATPDYLDYRDDRVNLFTTAGAPQNFYYMVRAVSPGVFQLGPVQADAMYDGQLHSYHGAGVVKVE